MPIKGPSTGPSAEAQRARLHVAAQALETLIVKQLVTASKTFTGGDSAGSAVRADMFAETLSQAMVQAGGIGLARQIEQSLLPSDGGAAPSPTSLVPSAPDLHSSSAPSQTDGTLAPVTSPFGPRQDPFDGHLTRHAGVDLAGSEGAPIRAAAGGVVRQAGARGGYGEAVEIDHGGGLTTVYAHASELLVREGDQVTTGQTIARVGHTGRATGPHLHFEVRQDGNPVDPRSLLSHSAGAPGLASPLLDTSPAAGLKATTPSRATNALNIYRHRVDKPIESGS